METSRDFTATAFVYWQGKTLLHRHKKLAIWLPCGGHIDPHELPDDAAKREVLEESGVDIELVGEKALTIQEPRQLIRPRGLQLEVIHQGHEHIDLIYFARPIQPYAGYLLDDPSLGWYSPKDLTFMDITDEIKAWTTLLFKEFTLP